MAASRESAQQSQITPDFSKSKLIIKEESYTLKLWKFCVQQKKRMYIVYGCARHLTRRPESETQMPDARWRAQIQKKRFTVSIVKPIGSPSRSVHQQQIAQYGAETVTYWQCEPLILQARQCWKSSHQNETA